MSDYILVNNFNDYNIFTNADVIVNKRRKKSRDYIDLVCAFDIETSFIPSIGHNIMYIWQFQLDDKYTIIGRTWQELMLFFKNIADIINDVWLIVYVHNLNYEFQFLRSLYDLLSEDVFCIASRKILKFDILNCIEFRCSYLQTNMSLDTFLQKMQVKNQKLKYDYKKIRYPDSELTESEIQYCINDVKGLVQALKIEMERDNDTLATIPLTSTGYVRRDVKRALKQWNYLQLQSLMPKGKTFLMLREAFRGGNTHANRYAVKNDEFLMTPIENVKSIDISSSYPSQQVLKLFPMTPFRDVSVMPTYDRLIKHYINTRGYAIIARLHLENVELKNPFEPCPYISLDKVRNWRGTKNKPRVDNGRILSADCFDITVTDLDLRIIDKQYKFKSIVTALQFAQYDYLPESMRELVKYYYKEKTRLKGNEQEKIFYDKFKNLINAIYGCSAQNPAKEHIIYDATGEKLYHEDDSTILERLQTARPTMPYQWGVWTTAHARYQLQQAIDLCGSKFVYCDTDSVKYTGDVDFTVLNNDIMQMAIEHDATGIDMQGKIHYMGVFEYEGKYTRFETKGAKSYIYEKDGKFAITIAGVPKEKGALELMKAGGFDAYKNGFIFYDGITETIYNDIKYPRELIIDGHKVMLTSNIVIKDSFHEIGQSAEYLYILSCISPEMIDKFNNL